MNFMANIEIDTSQNVHLELEPGSLGDRILGRIVDGLVLGAYMVLAGIIVSMTGSTESGGMAVAFIFLLLALPIMFYDLVLEMAFNGQSVGKKVMDLRVVSLDGQRPTLGQYLIRWLFRLVDFSLSFSLCALICVASSRKRQRLGDRVAGTAVVKITPRVTLQQTLYRPVQEDYAVQYPQAGRLREDEVQLIKEVLQHYQRTGNLILIDEAAGRVAEVLQVPPPGAPFQFLDTVLTDYNYLSIQA